MKKNERKGLVAALAFIGLSLAAGTAGAAGSVTGVISLTGDFDCACFAPGHASVVSQLMAIVQKDPASASSGFDDYAGSDGPVTPVETILLDPLAPGFPGIQPVYTLDDGTEFYASTVLDVLRIPLSCMGGVCRDRLDFDLIGRVSRAGYVDTMALLAWSGQGGCLGAGGVCSSQPSATWSATLISPYRIPEPASLAILGIGLLGLGAMRRQA